MYSVCTLLLSGKHTRHGTRTYHAQDRIEYEENKLIEFFGDEYKEFRAKTPTYIPLIK